MLALSIVLLSLSVSVASVFYAFRVAQGIERELGELRLGIENHTADEKATEVTQVSDSLDDCLREIFQEEEHSLMVLSMNELNGYASLARQRATALAKGMVRIPFLAGATGAIAAVAFGSFSDDAILLAIAAAGAGFVCSLTAQAMAKKAQRVARTYATLTESLASQVEKHWQVDLHQQGSA